MPEIKREVSIDIGIEIRCYECGSDVKVDSETTDAWGDLVITVIPCSCSVSQEGE